MPHSIRPTALRSASRRLRSCQQLARPALLPTSPFRLAPLLAHRRTAASRRRMHTSPRPARRAAHDRFGEQVPDQPPPTDFARMDVLGQTPAPATSVAACLPDGFVLGGADGGGTVTVGGGSGALLVGGEAFAWRPWEAADAAAAAAAAAASSSSSSSSSGRRTTLVNARGQWDLGGGGETELEAAFGVLALVWPRPDLLILGLGPEMRPLSPAVRKHIASLGIRVEVADTRNAASQFNLLATERGVDQVAAALIPVGWREGVGAG